MRVLNIWIVAILSPALLFSQNAESLLAQGIQQYQKSELSAALETFDQVLRLSPADARAITYVQLIHALQGECMRTLDELEMQARRNPDAALRRQAGLACLRCLAMRNDYARALPILADLLNRDPNDPDVLYEATQIYNRGYTAATVDLMQRAPDSYRAHQLSAQILGGQGRHAEAVKELQKAIELNPKAMQLHAQLARMLLRNGAPPEATLQAIKAFQDELALNPRDAVADYELAQVLAAQEDFAGAAAHYQQALTSRPNFPEALLGLAKIRAADKRTDEAVKLLQHAIEIAPNYEPVRTELISVYRKAGKNKDADRQQAELEKVHKSGAGSSADALNQLFKKTPE